LRRLKEKERIIEGEKNERRFFWRKSMKNTLKYALVSVLWPPMVMSAQIAPVKAYSETNVLEVYKALIGPQSNKSFLVRSTTVEPINCSVSGKEITDFEFREAMNAFHDVNEQVWDLSRALGDRKTISNADLDETFKPGVMEGWRRFRQRHPDSAGYVGLSAVGFNKAHTVAIVYSEVRCGGKCGAGGFKYFRHTPRGWRRVNANFPNCDWIS
jgi:hypothetical protein